MNERTHLDLFSGIGGFALAAQRCGVKTVAFCEIEEYAQEILKKNFGAIVADADGKRCVHGKPEIKPAKRRLRAQRESVTSVEPSGISSNSQKIFPDIRKLDGRQFAGVWLLTGGFPCQPFSLAGKRRGTEDDRHLWPEMLRVISEARPTWVIGENVAGFVSMELDNCVSDLEALGYACQPVVIPACAADAKHRRDRVWIIGYADGSQDDSVRGISERRRNLMGREIKTTQQENKPAGDNSPCGSGKNVADTEHGGVSLRRRIKTLGRKLRKYCRIFGDEPSRCDEQKNKRAAQSGSDAHSMYGKRRDDDAKEEWQEPRKRPVGLQNNGDGGWVEWIAEPAVGRVAHGISGRVDRLRGLGNAIVPQVAEEIIRAMIAIEEGC